MLIWNHTCHILTLYSSYFSGNSTDFTAAICFRVYIIHEGMVIAAVVYHVLVLLFYCSIIHLVWDMDIVFVTCQNYFINTNCQVSLY